MTVEANGESHTLMTRVTVVGQECPCIELTEQNMDFVRRGVFASMGLQSGVRDKPRADERCKFEGYPNVACKKQRGNAVYTVYRNAEGRSCAHWERWVPSDVAATNKERIAKSVDLCQGFYNGNHCVNSVGSDAVDDD